MTRSSTPRSTSAPLRRTTPVLLRAPGPLLAGLLVGPLLLSACGTAPTGSTAADGRSVAEQPDPHAAGHAENGPPSVLKYCEPPSATIFAMP